MSSTELTTIKEYYHHQFQTDLATMFQGMDARDVRFTFGNDWMRECSLLPRVSAANRPQFLVCLYFTVLADQAMHAHFYFLHRRFEELTMYPKFLVGFGHEAHLNAIRLFDVPIQQGLVAETAIREEISSGMQLFVGETGAFFQKYMPDITSQEFFRRLLSNPKVLPLSAPRHSLSALLAESLREANQGSNGQPAEHQTNG